MFILCLWFDLFPQCQQSCYFLICSHNASSHVFSMFVGQGSPTTSSRHLPRSKIARTLTDTLWSLSAQDAAKRVCCSGPWPLVDCFLPYAAVCLGLCQSHRKPVCFCTDSQKFHQIWCLYIYILYICMCSCVPFNIHRGVCTPYLNLLWIEARRLQSSLQGERKVRGCVTGVFVALREITWMSFQRFLSPVGKLSGYRLFSVVWVECSLLLLSWDTHSAHIDCYRCSQGIV